MSTSASLPASMVWYSGVRGIQAGIGGGPGPGRGLGATVATTRTWPEGFLRLVGIPIVEPVIAK
eukprot:4409959-Pyramimonas_sp.AAC.1